jgi:hypothetical protein
MGSESNVDEDKFIRLLILASCAGERAKLGANNFKLLMDHMGIKQLVDDGGFDSGRDSY